MLFWESYYHRVPKQGFPGQAPATAHERVYMYIVMGGPYYYRVQKQGFPGQAPATEHETVYMYIGIVVL